jgi:hypothetical protein
MGQSTTPLPMDRVYLINAGQSLTLGDRTLTAVRPPTWDNPITTGFVDDRTGALFSSDCFGALLPSVPASAADLDAGVLRSGQIRWTAIDSPWLHDVDRDVFARSLGRVRSLEPSLVCGSHLPPAPGAMLDVLLDGLAAVPGADRFEAPDQRILEAMLSALSAPAGSPDLVPA